MTTPIDGLTFFSGIDFQTILDKQKETLEKVKLSPIEQEAQEVQEKNSAVLEIAGLLDDFKSNLESLFSEDSFNVYSASVSNPSALAVEPGQDAVSGIYYIDVKQVATVQQIVSNESVSLSDTVLSSGNTFSIELYTKGDPVTISFTADSDMTIDDLINKINEEAFKDGIPISASKVPVGDGTYRLLLSTTITGGDYKFKSVNSDGNFGGYVDDDKDGYDDDTTTPAYTTIQNSQDAIIKLGSEGDLEITSSSNDIKDVIPGSTITVKEVTDSPVTIVIEENKDIIKQKLHDFVDSYNKLIDFIKSYASYDVDTDTAGPLFGDSGISMLKTALFDVISTNVNLTTSSLHNIFQLGIYLDTEGHLEVRDYELDYILETKFEDVKNLFTGRTNDIWVSKEGIEEDFIDDEIVLDEGEKFGLSIGGLKLEITAPSGGYTLSQLVDAINTKAEYWGIPVKASMVKVNIGDETLPEYVYKLRLEGTKTGSKYRLEWVEADSDILDGDGTLTYDTDDKKLTLSTGYENIQLASDALIEEVVRKIEDLTDGQTGVIPLIQSRYEDKLNLLKEEYDKVQKEIEREIERMREEFLQMEKIKAEMLSLQNTLESYFQVGDNND